MRILLTGASGLIGTAVSVCARTRGHEVIAAGRAGVSAGEVAGCAAVINLAGAPLMGAWWTSARRRLLRASRIDRTERLVDTLAQLASRPRVDSSAR